jgi:uncharacterized protein YihD (DUF1040 family)
MSNRTTKSVKDEVNMSIAEEIKINTSSMTGSEVKPKVPGLRRHYESDRDESITRPHKRQH